MLVLLIGLLLFLGTHSLLIAAPKMRMNVMAQHGRGAWLWPYIAASALGLVLIVWGYGLARQDAGILYTSPLALRHLALLIMLPVFPLLFAAYLPGRIRATLKHPMLIAVILWGVAHLTANGTVPDLLLFGGFAIWAAVDWYSSAHRPEKEASAPTSGIRNDVIAVVGGLLVYAIFLGGFHRILTGVSPI